MVWRRYVSERRCDAEVVRHSTRRHPRCHAGGMDVSGKVWGEQKLGLSLGLFC